MSIPAIIDEGIGPGSAIKLIVTLGYSAGSAPVSTNTQHLSRKARKPNQPLGFE